MGWFSKKVTNPKLEAIEDKIEDASVSVIRSYGTGSPTAAFKNGANWVIHNLTDDEIKYVREYGDRDKIHTFF